MPDDAMPAEDVTLGGIPRFRSARGPDANGETAALPYEEVSRRYQALGEEIRSRFEREVTVISVDVVHSTALKHGIDPLDAQITFDEYHRWVGACLAARGCPSEDIHWSGDGMVAIFNDAPAAYEATRALLEGLPAFNHRRNRLSREVQIRVGVHSGSIMTGAAESLGKLASPTLDRAALLQKSAGSNQSLFSETTYSLLHLEMTGSTTVQNDFLPVRRYLPQPTVCYAFPPHSETISDATVLPPDRSVAPSYPVPSHDGVAEELTLAPPPAAVAARSSRWVWIAAAIGGTILGGGVLATAMMPKRPAGGAGIPLPAPVTYQGLKSDGTPNEPGTVGNAPAPVTGGNEPAAPVKPPPSPPSAPGLSREAWTSPDATSGIPPTFIPAPPERKWLLSIGVSRYRSQAYSVPGAQLSAQTAAALLQQSAGVLSGHTRVITDEGATRESIAEAFQWLQQNAGSGKDTVFLYLAGTGVLAPNRPDIRQSGGNGYAFVPHDGDPDDLPATAVFGADIAAWLAATRCQTVVLILDTDGAAGMDLPSQSDPGRQMVLFAASGAQATLRRSTGISALVTGLAEGLQGSADRNGDQFVSTAELLSYLTQRVTERTGGAQVPEARTGFAGALPELQLLVRR